MDYKYIEQLLERYWEAETSPAEEAILRTFFSQEEIPAHLGKYRALFEYERQAALDEPLGEDFDRRVLALVESAGTGSGQSDAGKLVVPARRLTLAYRLRPLFRAAAAVAIVALIGTAAQSAFRQAAPQNDAWDYNSDGYADTYQKPEDALDAGLDGLAEIKAMLGTEGQPSDSAQAGTQIGE